MFIHKKNARLIHAQAILFLFVFVFFALESKGQDNKKGSVDNDFKLIEDFIRSRGYSNTIVFDASNVKQFWIDKSVASRDSNICILFNQDAAYGWTSVPLPVQLANVREDLDCRIDIISKDQNFDFSILDKKKELIPSSPSNEMFIDHSITSKMFHLEDTTSFLFYLSFNSKQLSTLSIEKIIFSFSKNKNSLFLYGPGTHTVTKDDLIADKTTVDEKGKIISVTGKNDNNILARNKIVIKEKPLTYSVKIKNTGNNAVYTYSGIAPYTQELELIDNRSIPYNNINKVISVVSSDRGSNTIVVDSCPDWEKNSVLVLNAKEDLSDFPNTNYLGYITDVKKMDNGQTQIVLAEPLRIGIEKGTSVRVQGRRTGRYLFFRNKKLEPGEEVDISSTISKDDDFLSFSPKALCRGVYCVTPVIVVVSVNPSEEYTVEISNYTISF